MNLRRQLRDLSDAELSRQLALESSRGKRGSWIYDINRHLALIGEIKRRSERKAA